MSLSKYMLFRIGGKDNCPNITYEILSMCIHISIYYAVLMKEHFNGCQ